MNSPRLISIAVALTAMLSSCTYISQGVLIDESRRALTGVADIFGDWSERVIYPDQNWDSADSLWFYNTTQGSNLMPYEMFLHLEQADSDQLFRADTNINRLRYLPQMSSLSNPDALPVGWVKDSYQGKDYIGLTCAACHTTQINYRGVGIRIDGGPALADMSLMLEELSLALTATAKNTAKFERLARKVLNEKYADQKTAFYSELLHFSRDIDSYNRINRPMHGEKQVSYGYARLDAFGRIYNRVLGHLTPEENNFNSPNAPVSYPQVWDTPQHDFVQWNGVGDNMLAGPLGRNVGQAIGVFASIDLNKRKHDIGYRSSVEVRNLNRLETHLEDLWSPSWEELARQDVLPPVNQPLADRGLLVYVEYQCHTCHEIIDRTYSNRRVVAQFASLSAVGTDPFMANNALSYQGRSGYFEGKRPLKPSLEPFAKITPALPAVSEATAGVLLEPDHDKSFVRRWGEKIYDIFTSMSGNPIKQTVRLVDFTPVDKNNPLTLAAYKARPLNGIWATAPYLHNGSVPNLYELFMPSCTDEEIQTNNLCRSNIFTVGAREFDPAKVGFVQRDKKKYPGLFLFDARLPGNSNKGHEYAAGLTPVFTFDKRGNIVKDAHGNPVMAKLPPITPEKRMALIEYLKTL